MLGDDISSNNKTTMDTTEEQEEQEQPHELHYYVIDVNTGKLVRVFSSRAQLLAKSRDIFGVAIGHRKLANLIYNHQVHHASNGSFYICVTDGLNYQE